MSSQPDEDSTTAVRWGFGGGLGSRGGVQSMEMTLNRLAQKLALHGRLKPSPHIQPRRETQLPGYKTRTWGIRTRGRPRRKAAVTPLMAGGLFWCGFFGRGTIPYASDYGLNEVIDALFFEVVHYTKAKFGLVFGAFGGADGKSAAKVVFNEGSFVARFLAIPGEHAESGEIAGLAFGATSARNEVLRMLAVVIGDAIQLEPGDRTNIGGSSAVANGVRKIQRDEASHNPSGDRNGLISWLGGGVRGRVANSAFAGRARSDGAHKIPILFFAFLRLVGGFFFVRDLNPIGNRTTHNLNGHAARK